MKQASEGELRRRVRRCHLLAVQAASLRQHRLALVVEVLSKQFQLRTAGVRIDTHRLILAVAPLTTPYGATRPCPLDDRGGTIPWLVA